MQRRTVGNDKKHRWSREDNKELICCWMLSSPERRGFRKRLYDIYQDRNPETEATEQLLAGQVRSVITRKVFSDVELEEFRRDLHICVQDTQSETESSFSPTDLPITSHITEVTVHEDLVESSLGLSLSEGISDADISEEDRPMFVKLEECYNTLAEQTISDRLVLPPLRSVKRNKLMQIVRQINNLCQYINTPDLKGTTDLMFAAATVVTEALGYSSNHQRVSQVSSLPPWKRRLQNRLHFFRQDLSRLVALQSGHLKNISIINELNSKYLVNGDSLAVAIETLRQKITALGRKIARFTARCEGFYQNKTFVTNQRKFYSSLTSDVEVSDDVAPEDQDILQFWSSLWGNSVSHNTEASWIGEVTANLQNMTDQDNIHITSDMISAAAKKLNNWKATGPDCIHNFWIKHLSSLHSRLAVHIQKVISGDIPDWLTLGRTVLLLKSKETGAEVVSNYRPITCLSSIWKLVTSLLSNEIIHHLNYNHVWPWEQKGCRRRSRGTKDHLLVDKLVMFLTRRRHRNLQMTWIDYRKAYDSVPHSWVLKVLSMYKIAGNVQQFLRNSMSSWRTVLTLQGHTIGSVAINRGIFQGDAMSPLLFVMCLFPLTDLLRKLNKGFAIDDVVVSHLLYLDDLKLYAKSSEDMLAMVNTVRVFSSDIRMEFGFNKCAFLMIKRGNLAESEGIELPTGTIQALPMGSYYKYLGVLEAECFCHIEVKAKVKELYKHRLRLILKSKLSGCNQITAINSFAVPLIRYTAGVIKWTVSECAELDRMTRKQLNMFKALHPRADVDRLYVPRRNGGRGLLSVSDVVHLEKHSLSLYVQKCEEPLMSMIKNFSLLPDTSSSNMSRSTIIEAHYEQWKNKALHGQWPQLVERMKTDSFKWLQTAHLKPVTEALITAAQDQALHTNWLSYHILRSTDSDLCRRCSQYPETIEHIVAGCPTLAQSVYLERHNTVASAVHWELCHLCGFSCSDQWWCHQPEAVMDSSDYRLLYDFNIFTDHRITARRPDIVLIDKQQRLTRLIDIACVMDRNVVEKHREKIEKYLHLSVELQSLWNTRTEVVPLVFGALGSIPEQTKKNFELLKLVKISAHLMQKSVILRTDTILRRHLALRF